MLVGIRFGQLQNALPFVHQLMRMCGPIETKMVAETILTL
jgi:hypothetical protein